MKLRALLVPLFLLILAAVPAPSGAATVHLYDGSIVRGEIVRFEQGVYTVRSGSLGEIRVAEDDIAQIDFADTTRSPAPGNRPAIETSAVQDLQRGMVLDPGMFGKIQSLQDDPQVQAVLQDPEVIRAMRSGDYATLLANPAFMALLQHPEIQSITREFLGGR